MTLYLTDNTTPEQVEAAHASGFVRGYKLYPAGATTNSEFGVTDVAKRGGRWCEDGRVGFDAASAR